MESVDSTCIIEEQKRIAAEEARLQARKAELDKLYRICRERRNAPVYWKNEENEIRRSGKDAIDVALEKDGF